MELYLLVNENWERVDVEKGNDLAFNYTFSQLSNPTQYVSEYSYTIVLPKTPKNNRLFSFVGLLDAQLNQFNNNFPYMAVAEGNIVSRGTAYIEVIDKDGYSLQLSGALYNIFKTLMSCGWHKGAERVMAELWGNVSLTPSIINNSFNTPEPLWDTSNLPQFPLFLFPHFAGFMPTNGLEMEGFDETKCLNNDVFEQVANGSKVSGQQMAEFRCSRLRPYIYIDKLWRAYRGVCKDATGYDMVLDDRWFNEGNDYLKNVCYTLPLLDDKSNSTANQHVVSFNTNSYTGWANDVKNIVVPHTVTATKPNRVKFEFSLPVVFEFDGNGLYRLAQEGTKICFDRTYYYIITAKVTNGTTDYFEQKYGFMIEPGHKGDNGALLFPEIEQSVANRLSSLVGNSNVRVIRSIPQITYNGSRTTVDFGELFKSIELPSSVTSVEDAHLELNYEIRHIVPTNPPFYDSGCPVKSIVTGDRVDIDADWVIYPINYYYMNPMYYRVDMLIDTILTVVSGSGSMLNMTRLMGGTKGFEVLLKYSKLMGLYWVANDFKKEIRVVKREDYFYDCFNEGIIPKSDVENGFVDLSDCVDVTTMEVKPLSWDARTVVLNYEVGTSSYAKEYNDKYGLSYGSIRIHTATDRNNEVVELLGTTDYDKIVAPIFSQEWIQPYRSYNGRVYKVKDDRYMVDEGNCFVFRLPNGTYNAVNRDGWRVTDGVAQVLLSGDTEKELIEGVRCYHLAAESGDLLTSVRPVFSDKNKNGRSFLMGEPAEYYSDKDTTEVDSFKGLYSERYESYFKEVYNPRNKSVRIGAWLDVGMYNRLKYNPFVTMGNVGYIVLEVSSWSDDGLTWVTMRQIDNYEALYKDGNNTIIKRPILDGIVIGGLVQKGDGTFDSVTEGTELPGEGNDDEVIQPM